MSELVDKVRSRGFWDVVVCPAVYETERVAYADLDDLLLSAVVSMRGWPVPYLDNREALIHGDTWIGQDIDASLVGHYEAWRFYTSGQFNHLRAVDADWRREAELMPTPTPPGKVIEVWEILFYLTEVFELAARLALSPAGDNEMTLRVGLHGLAGRGLIVGQPNRAEFFEPYKTGEDSLERNLTILRKDLVAEPRGLAVDMASEFFARFGWQPPRKQLLEHQRELTDTP
jgi:hypothetical protein